MKRVLIPVLVVFALVISGCTAVGNVLGMVPEEELQAATQKVSELEGQVAQMQETVANLETEKGNAEALAAHTQTLLDGSEEENSTLSARNEDLETLICSDHDWDDFWSKMGFWQPEIVFDPADAQAYLTLQNEWDFVVELTQWTPVNLEWQDSLPGYLIFWDGQSMVLDADSHCLILDPSVYRDLGR